MCQGIIFCVNYAHLCIIANTDNDADENGDDYNDEVLMMMEMMKMVMIVKMMIMVVKMMMMVVLKMMMMVIIYIILYANNF